MATIMTASVVKFIFPYGWDWNLSLMLGGILSATDPVAVVALLKELGKFSGSCFLLRGQKETRLANILLSGSDHSLLVAAAAAVSPGGGMLRRAGCVFATECLLVYRCCCGRHWRCLYLSRWMQ